MTYAKQLAPLAERIADFNHFASQNLAPFLDLILRVWLALSFFRNGVTKLMDLEPTVWLFSFVYPVEFISPESAAETLMWIELIAPLFLIAGLLSRPVAAILFSSAALYFLAYPAVIDPLIEMALLGFVFTRGAGPFSLDKKLSPALASSAFPFTHIARAAHVALTKFARPVYELGIRLVLSILFSASITGLMVIKQNSPFNTVDPNLITLLVLSVATSLLALGLFTRAMALGFACAAFIVSQSALGGAGVTTPILLLLLLVIVCNGPGVLSLDHCLFQITARLIPSLRPSAAWLEGAPHIVIVGGGFAGISTALGLRRARANVTLIDRRNYHLFQPLLYQVATASLSPADIATPIRTLARAAKNCQVVMGRVTDVDTASQQIALEGRRVSYDYLVLATGAKHSYFGKDEWEPFAPGLKKIDDATNIRRDILTAFEKAETTDSAIERKRLMTFVIVGGGPTGVELAGAIAELARQGMTGEFNRIDPSEARIILVQSAERVLPTMPEQLSTMARRALESLNVEVKTGNRVQQIDAQGVTIGNDRIEASTVVWAAGVAASAAGRWIAADRDRAGRIHVNPDLSVDGHTNIFAIGDTASCAIGDNAPLPGLAAVAKQQGQYVASNLRATIEGRSAPGPFHYKDYGSMATIGREKAVANLCGIQFSGIAAWWLWCAVHVAFMADARNRASVILDWVWSYLTYSRRIRLITGGS